jgi:hypothetical protein
MATNLHINTSIDIIRIAYKNAVITYPKMEHVFYEIMKEMEKIHIIKHMHCSFALFSDDNIVLTNPTSSSLYEYNLEKIDNALINEGYKIMSDFIININKYQCLKHKYSKLLDNGKCSECKTEQLKKKEQIKLPFGVFNKDLLLNISKSYNKLSNLDEQIAKLTPSIINSLLLNKLEKKQLIKKTKLIRKLLTTMKQ